MGFLDSHAHTSVSTTINKLIEQTSPDGSDGLMVAELGNLLDMIRLQNDRDEPGPTEAARAIRKKLKYGSPESQINSLNLLDLLVTNGGTGKMALLYSDRKLLDRLVSTASPATESTSIDARVTKKAKILIYVWSDVYRDDEAREPLVKLFLRCGFGHRLRRENRRLVPDFMADEADPDTPFEEVYGDGDVIERRSRMGGSDEEEEDDDDFQPTRGIRRPKTNSELDKQFRIPRIDYEKETSRIFKIIAEADVLSTNLQNSLRTLEPGELSIHSSRANDCFDECRLIRRRILRYLQLVDREELLGALLKCNDELVASLKRYEDMSEPVGASRVTGDSEGEDSLADYETDDSLDDGLDDRFKDLNEAKTKNILPEIPILKVRPPVPPKSPSLRIPKEIRPGKSSTAKPVVSKLEAERKEEMDADPFGDDNQVERATVWR
ncbi:hypothetical protein FOA43_002310 [Brettanomyces nanus]|uniref:VHS domain-containing protein n=1 Tax=Eeniella nana TaxID=13502 RepID=A0A875RZL0_EENNA|nr:uncharacterized protein FOA43_002310 [Brettanomyces nanus]QPG74971.1 hypothetical protein FOA43_002310 [Brettanomyces nanus]